MSEQKTSALSRQMVVFYRLYNERVMRRFAPHRAKNLSQGEMFLLSILVEHRELPLGELVERSMMSKQQVNRLLNSLEKKGLIERTRPAENRRIVLLKPTDEAIRLAKAAQSEIESALTEIFDALDERALDEYLSAIETINRILEQFPSGNRGG